MAEPLMNFTSETLKSQGTPELKKCLFNRAGTSKMA